MPIELAQGLGLFNAIAKKFCTNFSIQYFQSAQPMLTGLSSGQLQFAVYAEPNNILASAQGLNPVPEVIAGISQGGSSLFIAPASEEAIYGRGLPALKKMAATGKPLAAASLGGAPALVWNGFMDAAGADYTKLNLVPLGVAGVTSAVVAGRAVLGQASVAAANLISTGQLYNVLYTSGSTGYKVLGSIPQLTLNAMPQFTNQYPQLTQAVVNAALQGLWYIRAHWKNPGPAYNLLSTGYRATSPYTLWPKIWRYLVGTEFPVSGLVQQSDLANLVRLSKKYGVIDANYSLPSTGMFATKYVIAGYKSFHHRVPKAAVYKDLVGKVPN